ncbi:MAG: 16S rRNA (adenine(1518)-N(6)/adenine(1519)-N(6))-dimethyltransferase RsmA [Cyclonatronaceae bacterium]
MSLKPKQSLGQNFLRDPNILYNLALAAQAKPGERVVEIGPGEGALTKRLLDMYDDVIAVETDSRAVRILGETLPQAQVKQADILEMPWEEVIRPGAEHVIVGNIPYNITSPILFKVMDAADLFRRAVFTMQREVAERLVARPGSKSYSILSVQAQLLGSVEYLFTISRHAFYPKPKIESSVVAFTPAAERLPIDLARMKQVVRMAFNQRRKKLSNSLRPLLPEDAGRRAAFAFDLTKRPDQLYPEEFIKLVQALDAEAAARPNKP